MVDVRPNLFSQIRFYIKMSQELQADLIKYPNNWNKYQEIFNLSVDKVYQDILEFEKNNITQDELRVYRLKKIFEKRYRKLFLYGDYIRWCYKKPFGYSGDFKIIDDIYRNNPETTGFDRLWDNYFLQLAACKATRERKEDFKKIIFDFTANHSNRKLRFMNLASGPAREIKELIEEDKKRLFEEVVFDCCELDPNAIEYAKKLLNSNPNVNFIQKNAIRLALAKDIVKEIPHKYDLIYSTGLFDYLDDRIAARLVVNLRKLLIEKGMLVIANVRDKYSNSSASWMEWVAEWNLIYRTEAEFAKIFLEAGFSEKDFNIVSQKSGVMQYCFVRNE